jgi:pimeloyl-ACP methyl ester carboxylesterase
MILTHGEENGMKTFASWSAQGERIPLRDADGTKRRIFCFRRRAAGPHVTLLHGFPTSSFDWAAAIDRLTGFHLLSFDFLGFGGSDKPADHVYSLAEQADFTEQVWSHHGVERTFLVAHDYAVSVGQELLARRREGRSAVDLAGVLFLNGGLYPDLHRALPAQEALLDPVHGPQLSQRIGEETFIASLRMTFSAAHTPTDEEFHQLWLSVAERDGQRIAHRLIHYIPDRRANAERWAGALETADLPLRFVWGMVDPVSGAHVVPRLRQRLPAAPILCLEDVGHWPAIEAPEVVARSIAEAAQP